MWNAIKADAVERRSLDLVSRQRSYFTLRYLRPRYYPTTDSFKKATKQAARFNVLRQLDSDRSRENLRGEDGSAVTLMRAKTSLWVRPKSPTDKGVLGEKARFGRQAWLQDQPLQPFFLSIQRHQKVTHSGEDIALLLNGRTRNYQRVSLHRLERPSTKT